MNNESFLLGLVDGLEKRALGVGAPAGGRIGPLASVHPELNKPKGLSERVSAYVRGWGADVANERKDVAENLRSTRKTQGSRAGREQLAGLKGTPFLPSYGLTSYKNVGKGSSPRTSQSAKEDLREPLPPQPMAGRAAKPKYPQPQLSGV